MMLMVVMVVMMMGAGMVGGSRGTLTAAGPQRPLPPLVDD